MSGIPVQAEMFETGLGGYLRPMTTKPMSGHGPTIEKPVARRLGAVDGQGRHENSRQSYRELGCDGSDRRALVLKFFRDNHPGAYTDRQVMDAIYPGRGDLNLVRPRITELTESGHLREVGSVRCSVTGRMVRVSSATEETV